jgi:hypothetical protein
MIFKFFSKKLAFSPLNVVRNNLAKQFLEKYYPVEKIKYDNKSPLEKDIEEFNNRIPPQGP